MALAPAPSGKAQPVDLENLIITYSPGQQWIAKLSSLFSVYTTTQYYFGNKIHTTILFHQDNVEKYSRQILPKNNT